MNKNSSMFWQKHFNNVNGITIQSLLTEALNDLFEKQGNPRIAE